MKKNLSAQEVLELVLSNYQDIIKFAQDFTEDAENARRIIEAVNGTYYQIPLNVDGVNDDNSYMPFDKFGLDYRGVGGINDSWNQTFDKDHNNFLSSLFEILHNWTDGKILINYMERSFAESRAGNTSSPFYDPEVMVQIEYFKNEWDKMLADTDSEGEIEEYGDFEGYVRWYLEGDGPIDFYFGGLRYEGPPRYFDDLFIYYILDQYFKNRGSL